MGSNCCKGDAAGRPVVRSSSSIYTRSRAGASLDDRFITSDDAGGVRLTVSAARTGDSGVYTLQASNAAGKDTTRVRLEVSPDEAPIGDDPPNFLRRLQDLTVKVGTRTRFLVEIVSSTECKVTWYRNERRLMETERVALVRDGNFWCADVATVSVDDAGRWTCTAENVGGRASCSAHLNVLVPKAYKRPEFVEELRALLTEQGTVSLECKVVGVPTPILRWFKDSREIKAGDVFALTANADDPTSLGTYTCEAVNCMGRAYSSSKVHVVGRASREGSMRPSSGGLTPDPPPIFTKELEDQFVRICDPLNLSCHIVVPPWPRSVVWYNKEGKIEPSERYHVLEDGVGGYLLEVCSAEWADEGEWKCVASTAGGRVGMSACYVSMDVPKNYRKPRFMENLQAVLTEEGLVSFECKVVGFPTPVLSWFKDGQELKPGDVYQLTGTNSLGSYCCIAKNCMGQASSSAELTVEDIQNQLNEEEKHQLFSKNQAPKFLQGLKSVEAKIDEPFRFTIKVAIPPEPSLLWYRDDQPVDESSRCHHGKEDRGVFYLDIQNLEFLDQAEWKCVAINDFGQSVTSCFLKLIIPRHYKKPRFLENLQAILSDEGAVNLECKVIGVPQPVLKWYKDGEELKPGDIHRIISGQDGTCCLGTYTCEAQNCMGIAASSASLLGFDDSMKVKSKKKSEEQTLQRNLSLSTIHEERTSQMYDTPVGDRTLDDKGEISFSFDGKEVSVSLYETPDLTEEEALQIVEMYADQLSENVTEHNVVELPPLRFVKETSTSGNLLMEAIIIDVSPEYFASPEEDLRTEADIEDISIADENGLPQISLDQDQEMSSQDYLEKTMALLSDEKSDIPKKISRKMSDSQRSGDDYFSLSRDPSISEEKKFEDTQILSESDLQSFASARSSAKVKAKSSLPSTENPDLKIVEVTDNKLFKEDAETIITKPEVSVPKLRRRSSRGSRKSSSGSEKSLGKLKDEKDVFIEQPTKKLIGDEEYKIKINQVSNSLSKVLNDIQIIERDIILQSELMSSAATASKSLEIIGSLIAPLSEIQNIAEAAKEATFVRPEINSTLFNSLAVPFKVLYQSLTIIEKCVDVESDNKTLVKKTCVSLIEKCGTEIQSLVHDINTLISKKYLSVDETIMSQIESLSNEMVTMLRFSADTIKARNLLHEASEFKSEVPSLDLQHSRETQKAIFELKTSLRSLLRIVETTEQNNLTNASKINSSEIILNDMSASIQDLQEALEHIESLSIKESASSLNKYNTEIIETVMDSVVKLRSSFEQLSVEAKKEDNENTLKQVLSMVKINLNEISSHINVFENKVGKFNILQGENKLEVLQKMAQTLISFENSLPVFDILPDTKENMVTFHKHLTSILENVIEGNESSKYFAFLEICDTIRRLNSTIKNMESHDLFSLTSISNTLKIIQDQLVHEIFTPEINCSILSCIEDIQRILLKNINFAAEVALKADFESIQDLQVTKQDEFKANVVIQCIEHSITAINHVMNEDFPQELKIAMSPVLESIRPNLENLKQNIASLIAAETEREEHVSELSETSVAQTLASPLCELNQNIIVLNQTLLENVESLKENSEVGATYAQSLHELLTMLEVLQHEVISQHEEYISPSVISNSIANVIDNLQSCVLLIQEQSGVETADEMSTLEDVSGMKTNAEIIPSDHQDPLTTEVVYTEQLTDNLKVTEPYSVTAQTLQELNEHAIILQHPNILEFLDVLSECSEYTSLKSVTVRLEELNEGIQEILHPILVENMNEFSDFLDTSKLMQIAVPMQDLYHSLSIVDVSNIPIYEDILKMPSEQIHSVIEKLSDFKEHLETCLSGIIPTKENTDIKTTETLSNMDVTKKVCVDLKNIIHDLEQTSVGLNPEVTSFKHTLTDFLDAIDEQEHMDAEKLKKLLTNLNQNMLIIQDDLIQCKSQPCETITQEVKLIETVHQLERNIAVLEQYEFVDLCGAYDIDSYMLPQLAQEVKTDSLKQIEDLVNQAVNIMQDVGHESQTADLMILEDFFINCKVEFSILRCLITKQPSHKKIIRLLQEFNYLRFIIQNFKNKRAELSLSDDINELLSNFMFNLDTSMKDIEDHLIQIANSQSKLLFEIPLVNLNENSKKIMDIKKVNKVKQIVDFLNVFLQFIEDVRPNFDNLKVAIMEELQSTHINIDKNMAFDESMDLFLNYVEKEVTDLSNENQYKKILENICSCLQKHQDCKDIVGQSKALMLLKCLSECSTILIQILTDEKEQNKQFLVESEVIELKSVLNEMVEPLQGLRSQLLNIQEQIASGADEESISIDVTSTESYVQALTEINNDVLQLLQSEKTVVDEADLSLIEELDKEIHIIQENIQSTESTAAVDVSKQIALPLESIGNTLLIVKEKMSMETKTKIPRDINSNVSSLEYFLNRFIKLETDILETSELITDIDLKKCLSLAIEITNLLNPRVLSCDIDSANEIKHEKLTELTHLLMKFDWINTDRFCENRDEVMIQKLKLVFLSAYQLLSELNKNSISIHGPGPTVSEDQAEALLRHIDQYIEFVEIVEEVSAVIKIEDLLETANIARELRDSIDDVAKCNQEICEHIQIDTTQELLMQRLHSALSEFQVQALDSVLEMVPTFDGNKKQHVIEVLAALRSDLSAITGSQVAVIAPENELEILKPLDSKTDTEESKLIPEDSIGEINLDVSYKDVETIYVGDNENIVDLKEIVNQEYSEVSGEKNVATSVEDAKNTIHEDQNNFAIAQSLLTTAPTIGTLLEHIDEYIYDDVIEIVSQLAAMKDVKELKISVDAAKELRESIIALQVSPLEDVTVLQNVSYVGQGESLCQLREALNILEVLTLHNTEELKDVIGYQNFERILNLAQNLHADLNAITCSESVPIIDEGQQFEAESRDMLRLQDSRTATLKLEEQAVAKIDEPLSKLTKLSDEDKAMSSSSDIKEQSDVKTEVLRDDHESCIKDVKSSALSMSYVAVPQEAQIDQVPDMEDIDSIKKLEMLLTEVTNQVELYSTVQNTEFLRNTLDEVQTVIIKLKRDFDGSANDTLNETLEDLECSVRSVQLQIDENSAPNLLKDACATLQLLVTNMSDIKGHVSHPASEQTANTILQKCSEQAEQTIKLLDEAAKADDADSQMINMISKINILKDVLKILWTSFQGDANSLINNGIDINQRLDQMEGQIFSLEKEIEGVSCKPDTKDSLIVAVHAVYENISNMRSAISSIQKDFMYNNYGIPSEKFLHSLKNTAILYEIDNNMNWKHFGKVLRQVLNHFEDIKFYVNFDKTARIPSDAAFTKIILDELTKELKCVVLADVLESHPEMSEAVRNVIKSVEECTLSLQSRSSLEVKEKIPIFKNISELMLLLTNDLIKNKKVLQSLQTNEALERQQFSDAVNISESTISHEQIKDIATIGSEDNNKQSLTSDTVLDATLKFAAIENEEIIEARDKRDGSIESCHVEKSVIVESDSSLPQEEKIDVEQQEKNILEGDILQVEKIREEVIKSEVVEEQEIDQHILNEEHINDKMTDAEPSCSYAFHPETEALLDTEIETTRPIQEQAETYGVEIEQNKEVYMDKKNNIKKDDVTLKDKAEPEKNNECTEIKLHEVEMLHIKQDKGEAEKELLEDKERLNKEKEDAQKNQRGGSSEAVERQFQDKASIKNQEQVEYKKEEVEEKQVECETRLEIEKENSEMICLEKENQDAEDKRLEDTLRSEKGQDHAEKKHKEDKQESKGKQKDQEDVTRLDKESIDQSEDEVRLQKVNEDFVGEKTVKIKQAEEKQLEDNKKLEKEDEDAEIKRKEEELLCLEKQEQVAANELVKGEMTLEKEKKDSEIKPYEEETLQLVKELQERQLEEEASLQRDKEDVEIRRKEEEMLRCEKEKQEAEKKQLKDKETLGIEKEDAEIKSKEKEKSQFEKEKQAEKGQVEDKVKFKKDKESNEIDREEEETLRLEREKQEAEEKQLKDKATQDSDKQDTEMKIKQEESLSAEKEEQEAENNKLEDKKNLEKDVQIKSNDDETLFLEREQHKAEENLLKDKTTLESVKENAEFKRNEEERLCIEQKNQGAEENKLEDKASLKKENEIVEISCKEETLRPKKEAEEQQSENKASLEKLKETTEIDGKEETLRLEREKQEAEEKQEKDKKTLESEKEAPEKKHKEEETIHIEKEKPEVEKQLEDKAKLEKEDTKINCRGEETLRLEKEKREAKEKQEKDEVTLKSEDENAEIKRKEEEMLHLEKEKQEAEERQRSWKVTLESEKEDDKLKSKEEDRLRIEKEIQQAAENKLSDKKRSETDVEMKSSYDETVCLEREQREAEVKQEKGKVKLKSEKEDADIKCKKEETLGLENEKQEVEEQQRKEKEELEKETDNDETKRKEEGMVSLEEEKKQAEEKQLEDKKILEKYVEITPNVEEMVHLEEEKQQATKKQIEDEVKLEKEKEDSAIKRKKEETLRIEKEKQKAEEKQEKEKSRFVKEKEDIEIKRKEEETLRLEKEKQEAEEKQEKDDARLEKEKDDAEIKRMEEETLRLEKEKQEAEEKQRSGKATLESEKEDHELRSKEEDRLRIEKEIQEAAENKLSDKNKSEKDVEMKSNYYETVCLEREQHEAEVKQEKGKATLKSEKEDAEIKCKKEETLGLENEKQEVEEQQRKEKEELEKETENDETKRKEEEMVSFEEKKQAEEKQLEDKKILEKDVEITPNVEEMVHLEEEKQQATKKQIEDEVKLEKEKDSGIKRKKEEPLRIEKEKQEAEEKQEKDNARLEKEKENAEIKRMEVATLHIETEKQEAEDKQEKEKSRLQKEKEDAEIKRKEEETLRLEKKKQEAEEEQKKNKARLDKEKEDAEIKRMEVETLHIEKEKQEAEDKQEKEESRLVKEKEDAEIKRKEEETFCLEKEKQEAEEEQEKNKARLVKEKEDAAIKCKEEETLRLEKEKQEAIEKQDKARLEKEKQDAEIKRKEETLRIEKEKQEAEKQEKEKARLVQEKDAEIKRREEETLRLEKEKQEAIEKQEKDKARLEKDNEDTELKCKEEETLRLEKKKEAEEKQEKDKARLEKEKEDAKMKRKEEETLRLEKEKQEAEQKQEKEKARLVKEREDAEIKRKEEETLHLEKEKQEAEEQQEKDRAKLEKEKEDAEIKRKEETLRLEKEKQEAEEKQEKEKARLVKEKEDAELKRKEEETLRLEKEKQESIEKQEKDKARLEKEKEDAEIKCKKETLRLKKEKQEAEEKQEKEKARLVKEKEDVELKRKEEETLRLEKEKQESIEKQEKEKARLEKEEDAKMKRKEEDTLRLEKEKQEAQAKQEKNRAKLEKESEDAEMKRKEEETLRIEKEEQEAQDKQEKDKARLEKEKEDAAIKCKEEETLRLEKEKQEVEEKQEKDKARLVKEKEDTEIKRKEKETLHLEKEKQEAEEQQEKDRAKQEKEREDAEIKRKEEETLRIEKEKQEAEDKQEKEDAETKPKNEETLRLEKEKQETKEMQLKEIACLEKEKGDAEKKRKEEEKLCLEKEKQDADEKQEKDTATLEKEKRDAEIKLKEETLRLEKEKQEAEEKQEKDKVRLEKEKEDAEIKRNEEESYRLDKEKRKAEKRQLKEKARLEKEKEDAVIKRKEEETLRLEKEKQEGEEKQEKDKARLEKEKDDAEKKRKEEEMLHLEKEKQEAEEKQEKDKARLEKEKQDAEIKSKKEETLRLEKEKQEAEEKQEKEKVLLEKEKEDAEIKRKEEESLGLDKEKRKAEKKQLKEKARLEKEKEDAEMKRKEEETLRLKKEKLDAEEKQLEDKVRLEKKKEDRVVICMEEESICIQDAEIKQLRDRTRLECEIQTKETKLGLKKVEQETQKKLNEAERRQKVEQKLKNKIKDEPYEIRMEDNSDYKFNGSMDKYKIGEIDISSSGEAKHVQKDKLYYINYNNNNNIGLEMYTPPGYVEKRTYDNNRFSTLDIDTTRNLPPTYKTQTLLYQSQLLRSSTPQYYEVGRSSESIEKLDLRHRSKALSETRSSVVESRSSALRDHKRKPVFSTYLTDRTSVEASRVKLTCSVLSSTDPTITWFKNGVLLDNKLKYKTKNIDGLITLEVLNAIPSDSAEYTCTVQNESGSVSTSANLKVYPSFEASPIPPTFTRSIRDTYHLAENELVLESRIRGQPLPTITWLKDDRPLHDDERYQAYYLADGVCRLVINAPVTADSGKYTCKAENSMWSDQITHVVNFTGKESSLGPNLTTIDRSRFNRQLLESRRPHFTNVLTDYKVTRGGTIGLQVEIKGSPTRVEWLREGNTLTETHRNAQTFVDRGLYTLALSDVTEKESGLYTCRAWSSHGNVDMNAAITVVQPNELEGKPAIIVGRPEKDILISVGEDLNISFRAQGEPKPKVIFMKGIRDITNSQRVCKMTSDDYVKFTLKRTVVSDAGTYCVLARNAYGCDRAFVTVVVRQRASSENLISDWTYSLDDTVVSTTERKYKAVPDRIPGEPSVVDGGNNWVSLAWPKPEHQETAPVLAYKVENWLIGKEGGARWRELGITPLNSFDAFNLKQGEEYHFRVTPRNRYGWGEAVQTSNPIGIGLAGDRPEFTETLPGQLKVLVGETANLSCSFKGKPTPEIIWMKNGHEIEDDDARVKTLLNGCDCCLTIKDVQVEDEARYSCEASNVHGRASTYARMAVITDRLVWEADAKLKRERSAGVEGEYPPQFTMRLRDRRVQATYPVRLTCQVIGNPTPLLTWFKDGSELHYDNRHNQCQDEHFHTLEIAPTSLEDGGAYEAMARNSSGAVSCRCSLVVDKGIRAYVAPEFCCGLEPLYRLYEGEELRISAMVEAYPSVGVTWYRDGVRLRPSRRAIMTLDHDGQIELALASVTRRDAGVYMCTASNEVGQASTSGKVDVIGGDQTEEKTRTPPVVISPDVPYSKEPMFTRKPRSSEAREGDTVIIECEVIGDPKPDVYWLRDFLKPDYYRDASHFKRVGAGPEYRFEIPHAKLDYTGTYSVVARNVHGEAKAIISLQILAKDIDASDDAHNIRYGRVDVIPRFDKELTDLLCYDGDAIEFECRVSGDPEPYIKWYHYNEVIRDSQDFETCYDDGTARLKIKQVTAEDEGTYTCEASNSLGRAKSSACLVVYPPGEPNTLSQRLRRPPALLSAASTPRSTPRATPARSLSRTPGPDPRRLSSPSREIAPKFYTYPFNKVVEEGERVVFKCAVKGLPNPWATWDKDGIILTPTSRITMREKDEILRILEIEEVTIEDVGLYRITVENDYGRAEASARLEVITHKGKFYAGVRSCSPSPRRTMFHRRRTPSTTRQD